VPVLTGIGHERDSTVLDEVAHQRYDTPSKVVAGIQALIVKRARESQAMFDEVAGLALRRIRTAGAAVEQLDAGIRRQAMETVTKAGAATRDGLTAIQRQAQRVLHDGAQGALEAIGEVEAAPGSRLATAARRRLRLRLRSRRIGRQSARARTGAEAHLEEVDRLARNSLRWGAEAAEATFREVVAQGPEKTLGRGFAVVKSGTGQVITSAAAAGEAAEVRLQFQDGSIDASVHRGEEKETMSNGKTFKEAYGTLQRHAQTLRSQQEPDIDNLTTIVTESVEAYKVCKERIDAVEKALEQALGNAQIEAGPEEARSAGAAGLVSTRRRQERRHPVSDRLRVSRRNAAETLRISARSGLPPSRGEARQQSRSAGAVRAHRAAQSKSWGGRE
jgi:exonuclease VII large subunit